MKKNLIHLATISALFIALSTNINAQWALKGNSGTNPAINFIGTKDSMALKFRVNNIKAGELNPVNGNVSLGMNALPANTNGFKNVAIGSGALNMNLTGNYNTANGGNALYSNVSGTGNTAVGYGANVGTDNLTNATAIGYNAIVNSNNSLVLGNNANVGIGTPTPHYPLDVAGNNTIVARFTNKNTLDGGTGVLAICSNPMGGIGVLGLGGYIGVLGQNSSGSGWGVYSIGVTYSTGGYTSSDAKLKKDVRPIENAMDKINQLQPRTYNFKTDEYNSMGLPTEKQYGFIAQELETVFPEMVRNVVQPNVNGDKKDKLQFKAINYTELIPVLTQALKEQNKTIEQLKSQLATVEHTLQDILAANNQEKIALPTFNQKAGLAQNQPNPFNQKTLINYFVPADAISAIINIISTDGKVVRSFALSSKGSGHVELDANSLSSGIYSYQLIVDGKTIDVKKMTLTK